MHQILLITLYIRVLLLLILEAYFADNTFALLLK